MWNNDSRESSFVDVFICQVFFVKFFFQVGKIENEKEPPLVLLMCFGFKILMCVHIICIAKPSPKQAEFETGNNNNILLFRTT